MNWKSLKFAAAVLLLWSFAVPLYAQDYVGIGLAESVDGLELVQGHLDVGARESVSMIFIDESGILDATTIAVNSQGDFFALTSNLWIAAGSPSLSAVLLDEETGEVFGRVAIVAMGSPNPSTPMDADSVNGIIDSLPPGNSPGVHVVGTESELDGLFGDITVGGNEVTGTTYAGILVQLPDGTLIGIRPNSSSGGPGDTTIDIKYPDGSKDKVHIDPCSPGN